MTLVTLSLPEICRLSILDKNETTCPPPRDTRSNSKKRTDTVEKFFILAETTTKTSGSEIRKEIFCGGMSKVSVCEKIKKEKIAIWEKGKNDENSRLHNTVISFEIFVCEWNHAAIAECRKVNGISF